MTAGFPNGTPLRRGLLLLLLPLLPAAGAAHDATRRGRWWRSGWPAWAAWGRAALAARLAGAGWAGLRRAAVRRAPAAVAAGRRAAGGRRSWPLVNGTALDATLALPHGVPAAWRQVGLRPRPRPAGAGPGDGAPRSAVRLLSLGRHGRPDPAGAQLAPGRRARHHPLRRPARRRPACGASTRWSPSSAPIPASCARCSTCSAWARWSSAPTATSRAAARWPRRTPPGCWPARGSRGRPAAYGPARAFQSGAGPAGGAHRAAPGPALRAADGRHGPRAPAGRADDPRRRRRRGDRPGGARRAALRPGAALRRRHVERRRSARRRAAGANLVISDSNRRQILATSSLFQNTGPVLGPTDPISKDSAQLDPFPQAGQRRPDGERARRRRQLRALDLLPGLSAVPRASAVRRARRRPEHRVAGRSPHRRLPARPAGRLSRRPRTRALRQPHARTTTPARRCCAVSVDGQRFAIHPGLNHLVLSHPARVSQLTVSLDRVTHPRVAAGGGGGIRELAIPGVHATETLRPPVARPARPGRHRPQP